MKNQITTPALVLKRRNYAEADRILTLLTPDHGKVDVRAKGVRKPTSRKRGHIELFTHLQAHIVPGRWLPILTQAQAITQFNPLRNTPTQSQTTSIQEAKIFHAYHLAEITDRLIPENEPQPQIFDMLIKSLTYLQKPNPNIAKLHHSYKLRLLQILGFWPQDQTTPLNIDHYLAEILERPLKTTAFLNT